MKIFRKLLFFLVIIFFIYPPGKLYAKKVAVVLSNEHAMYEKIYENFRNSSLLKGVVIKKYIIVQQGSSAYIEDALKGGGFDAVFSIGTNATRLMKDIGTIPTVFSMVVNPKYFGFIGKDETSLPNLCGISIEVPVEEQLKLLKKVCRNARKIGVIYDPSKSGYTIARAVKTSSLLGLEIYEVPIKSSPEVPQALSRLEGTIDVLFAIVDDTVYKSSTMGHILLRCLKRKIPVIGFSHTITKAGAVFSTYIDFQSIGDVGAERVSMILNGALCEDIPFAFMNKWMYSINLAVSKRLGIDIPPKILANADAVVE